MPGIVLLAVLATPLNVLAGTHDARIHEISGKTMGTYYHVKISHPGKIERAILKTRIDDRLNAVNQSMSMFLKSSEISRFNRSTGTPPLKISEGFAHVLDQARTLHELTGGAWDGTIKPLVDLWGFGTKGAASAAPDQESIHQALATVGFSKIILTGNLLSKQEPRITLDLGSIAKGYGVDQVARELRKEGFGNVLVEIGGEVVARGEKRPGSPWNVGIATPDKKIERQTVYRALPLKNQALATSGDYRNFTLLDERAYSHIIDPATGYPIKNGVVSASVLAPDCTIADGLATALMVMGEKKGLILINKMARIECLIIVQKTDGSFENRYSDNFPQ